MDPKVPLPAEVLGLADPLERSHAADSNFILGSPTLGRNENYEDLHELWPHVRYKPLR